MTTLGDGIYGASGGTPARLAGNTTAVKQFLNQTGTGSASAAPAWGALSSSDIPWASPGYIGYEDPASAYFLPQLSVSGLLDVLGDQYFNALPPVTVSVSQVGTTGTVSYQYAVTAVVVGETGYTAVTTTTGNAVLSGTNYNQLSWSAPTDYIPEFYNVYRIASGGSPSSTGFIGLAYSPGFNDTGIAATGSVPEFATSGAVSTNTLLLNYLNPNGTGYGSSDQILGIAHNTTGNNTLEYKTLTAGSGITITPAAGTITISSTGGSGFTNPMTTLGDLIYGTSGGNATRLAGNTSSTKEFLIQTGTGTTSAAPTWGSIASADLPSIPLASGVSGILAVGNMPSTTVNSAGILSPLFTTSISSQNLSFTLSNAAATSWFGNASGSSAVPGFNTSLIPNSLVNWASPGAIGSGTAASGTFSTLTLTSNVSADSWFGNASGSAAPPSFNTSTIPLSLIPTIPLSQTSGTLPFSDITGTVPLAQGGTGMTATGTADQIIGVNHTSGTGLEYKTLTAGSGITITPAAGSITISATGGGGFTNPMTALGDLIYGTSGGSATRLVGNTSSTKEFLIQTGTGTTSAAPTWGSIASADLPSIPLASGVSGTLPAGNMPSTTVNSAGTLSPLFTTSISSQNLSFTLSNAAATSWFGNASGSSAVPGFNTSLIPNSLVNWASPGAIGNGTAASGTFSTLTLTSNVSADSWFGNASASASPPSFNTSTIPLSLIPTIPLSNTSGTLPFSDVTGTVPLAQGGTGMTVTGTADQIIGVNHTSGTGLEYKTLTAGSGITITPAAGSITIAASGGSGFTNPMTTLGDLIYGAASGTATRLAGNSTTAKQFLTQAGTGTAAAAPGWNSIASSDLPIVNLINQLRVYATSGSPFSNTTYTTASVPVPVSTLYIGGRPDGNQCTFNQGTFYQTYGVSETAFAVTGLTASTRYDLYMKVISGTVTTSTAAWTGTATPPTRGADAYGRATKNGDTTSLLIGTFLANTATTASLFTSVSDTVFYAGTPAGTMLYWWQPNSSTPIPNGFALCNGASAVWETGTLAGTTFTLPNTIGTYFMGSDVLSGTSTSNASGFGSPTPKSAYGATSYSGSTGTPTSMGTATNSSLPEPVAVGYHTHAFSVSLYPTAVTVPCILKL